MRHLRKFHDDGSEKTQHAKLPKNFSCVLCSMQFYRRANLMEHVKQVHKSDASQSVVGLTCNICNRTYKQKTHVQRHRETLHVPVQQAPLDVLQSCVSSTYATNSANVTVSTSFKADKDYGIETSGASGTKDTPGMNTQDASDACSKPSFIYTGPSKKSEGITSQLNQDLKEIQTSCNEQTHQCFVCLETFGTEGSYRNHLELHRVWVPDTVRGGPKPSFLFSQLPNDCSSSDSTQIEQPNQTDQSPGSATTVTEPKGVESQIETREWFKASLELKSIAREFAEKKNEGKAVKDPTLVPSMEDMSVGHVLSGLLSQEQIPLGHIPVASSSDQITSPAADVTRSITAAGNVSQTTFITEIAAPKKVTELSRKSEPLKPNSGNVGTGEERSSYGREDKLTSSDWTCPYCFTAFPSLAQLHEHKVDHHLLQLQFRCVKDQCQQIFQTAADYKEHNNTHSQLSVICNICNAHFADMHSIATHKSLFHRRLSLLAHRCHVCQRSFSSRQTLDKHLSDGTDHYPCTRCGRICKSEASRKEHEQIHIESKLFLCEACGASFTNSIALNRHRLGHNPKLEHKCDLCGQTFNKAEHLCRHLVTKHSDKKPYVCPKCGKGFKRIDKLKDHQKMHTNVKPYGCGVCGRRYRYKDGLRYHERTHKRDKKFVCTLCSVPFPRPGMLGQHLLDAHGIATRERHLYPCAQCHATFGRPERVRRHMERDHHLPVAWKVTCPICKKGFPGRQSLTTHMTKQHDGVESHPTSAMETENQAEPQVLPPTSSSSQTLTKTSQQNILALEEKAIPPAKRGRITSMGKKKSKKSTQTATTVVTHNHPPVKPGYVISAIPTESQLVVQSTPTPAPAANSISQTAAIQWSDPLGAAPDTSSLALGTTDRTMTEDAQLVCAFQQQASEMALQTMAQIPSPHVGPGVGHVGQVQGLHHQNNITVPQDNYPNLITILATQNEGVAQQGGSNSALSVSYPAQVSHQVNTGSPSIPQPGNLHKVEMDQSVAPTPSHLVEQPVAFYTEDNNPEAIHFEYQPSTLLSQATTPVDQHVHHHHQQQLHQQQQPHQQTNPLYGYLPHTNHPQRVHPGKQIQLKSDVVANTSDAIVTASSSHSQTLIPEVASTTYVITAGENVENFVSIPQAAPALNNRVLPEYSKIVTGTGSEFGTPPNPGLYLGGQLPVYGETGVKFENQVDERTLHS